MSERLSGAEFKKQLRASTPKLGLFLNSHSPTVAEQLAFRRYDGLLGYAGTWNDNVICALQVETADCIRNIDAIAAVKGVDMLFLGQNDLCMSMGLYEKYKFPDMYTSPELNDATTKLVNAARKNN